MKNFFALGSQTMQVITTIIIMPKERELALKLFLVYIWLDVSGQHEMLHISVFWCR